MSKEFYDKHSKDLGCHICSNLQQCINCDEPLWINCSRIFYKERTADLEAKLAEWESDSNATLNEYRATKYENNQLKQQLAEKEKVIDNLMNGTAMLINKSLNHNQDKISFAVEQLEQIFLDFNKKVDDEFGDIDIKYITLDVEEVNFYLKDKIKSIKEGK